ncbi:MAG: tetratricopeptide repeat protein [Planctomycetota bacterium]
MDRPTGTPEQTSSRRDFLPWLLIIAGFAVYMGALPAPFHFDDVLFIKLDPAIQRLWPIGGHPNRPVLTFSLALNNAIAGMDPARFRAVNVAIHIAAALLLYGLVRRTLLAPHFVQRFGESSRWLAFGVASLWLLHPLHTQAVTYLWQRSESMMGMFFLAALYCVVRASEGRRAGLWCSAAMLACLLGLGTKEVMAAVFPVIFLYDGILLSSSFREALRRRIWLYAAFLALGIVLIAVVLPKTATTVGAVSRSDYAASQPGVILRYLGLSLWPGTLCFDYGLAPAKGLMAILPATIAIFLALVATGWLLFKRSWLGVLLASFFLILAPTSSIVPINDLMAEYRMYLPLATLAVLFVVAVHWLSLRLRVPLWALLLPVALALGTRTIVRNGDYMSFEKLWLQTAEAAPDNPRAYHQLGSHLLEEGKPAAAVPYLEKSLELRPKHRPTHWNLAQALRELGDFEGAILHVKIAQRKRPKARSHCMLGHLYSETNRFGMAADHYRRALAIKPKLTEALEGLAKACAWMGKIEEALKAAKRCCELEPDSAGAWAVLGQITLASGATEEAIKACERSLELDSKNGLALCGLGMAQARRGNAPAALQYIEKGLNSDPSQASSMASFAYSAASHSKGPAQALAVRICELTARSAAGNDPEILANLARCYALAGRPDLAGKWFEKVVSHPAVVNDEARQQAYQREWDALGVGR